MRSILAIAFAIVAFMSTACARRDFNVYHPTKDRYVLIKSIDNDMQRFQYVLNPTYLVYEEGDTVEIWGDEDSPIVINNVTCVTTGPNQ